MGVGNTLNGFTSNVSAVSSIPPELVERAKFQSAISIFSLYYKHIIHVICMFTVIGIVEYGSFCHQDECHNSNKFNDLPPYLLHIATAVQLIIILPLPQVICNTLGLTFYNTFPGEIKVNRITSSKTKENGASNGVKENGAVQMINDVELMSNHQPPPAPHKNINLPHLCFRVVTRGSYPELVQNNVRKNFLKCIESGLINFSIEVVTDNDIHLISSDQRIKQIIVPKDYRSSTGALFKARALQYALEPGTSKIEDHDWIVHLDEETLLTKNVVNGILNFALDGTHDFGQGLITYLNTEVVNLFTTLADSYRVSDDMGKMRFTLGALHRPIFGWKGSFVVTRCAAEKDVSFDHGQDGSIAEDCYFSMVAYNKGYTFNFIQGEMFEKSPFTVSDLIRQRRRWFQGIWLVVHSSKIPIRTKFFLAMSHYAWFTLPVTTSSYLIVSLMSLPVPEWLHPIGSYCFAMTLYMYVFGLVKSYDLKKGSILILLAYMIGQVLVVTANMVVENIAVVWGIFTPKHTFYVVKKDLDPKVELDP